MDNPDRLGDNFDIIETFIYYLVLTLLKQSKYCEVTNMKWEKKISEMGNSAAVVIPSELLKYMDLKIGDIVEIQDDESKYGKFVSFWKKEETTTEQKSAKNKAE